MTTVESSFEKARRKLLAARIEFMGQLAKFKKAELSQQPTESEWSPLQLAYHLYIADGMALEQMRRVQNEELPLLENLTEEVPRQTNSAEPPASLDAVLAGLAARREELFEYLSSLPEDAWLRPYRTSQQEERKFYQLVNVLPHHDQEHARQLTAIKSQKEA